MLTERQRLRIEHIVENAERIASYVAGLDYAAFAADPKTIDAVERCLARITEAAIRAGDETMASIAPDIPPHIYRGFGNALRHDYDLMDMLVRLTTLPLYASGGIAALSDLRVLAGLGVTGAILGMALYVGTLDPRAVAEEFAA